MRITGNELLNYDEYLDLQTCPNKSFEDNQEQGFLAKQVICHALYRFKFLDKTVLMNLLNFNKSNEGGFYRIIQKLKKERCIKTVESKYTQAKSVYALKPNAFRTYLTDLDNVNPSFYPRSNAKLGLGVRATHHLTIANHVIKIVKNTYLQKEYMPDFLNEREIRANADFFPRTPDALINLGENETYLLEYEFSEKNKADRRRALVNADRNVDSLIDTEYEPDYEVETYWILKNQTMKSLYDREIDYLVRNGIEITENGIHKEHYHLNRNYHTTILQSS